MISSLLSASVRDSLSSSPLFWCFSPPHFPPLVFVSVPTTFHFYIYYLQDCTWRAVGHFLQKSDLYVSFADVKNSKSVLQT